MKAAISHLRQTRNNLLAFFEKHEGKANFIPKGFNNNLYWNFAHCIVTQQLLIYKLSGNEMLVDEDIINKYRKGTKVDTDVPSSIEVAKMKDWALATVDQLEKDYESGVFTDYTDYPTSFGVTLKSVEDAILFNNVHEGLHFGYMMAMVK